MSKKKKQNRTKKVEAPQKSLLTSLTERQKTLLSLGVIVVVVLIYFAPIVFQGKQPPASDTLAWKGNAQSIVEAREKYNYNPLWANNVFSGMPAYMISLKSPFEQPVHYILLGITKIFEWRAFYYILGALGMFLLMRFFGCSHMVSLFVSMAFVWWPNLMGLLEAGHNTKLRTIMFLPYIVLFFLKFLKKPNFLYISLFTIAFSLALRARHYQIVFYCGLLLSFLGVAYFILLFKKREIKGVIFRVVPLLLAVILAFGISAFPSMLVQDYSKYSIRGGTGEAGSTGLSHEYATQWSLHPAEMFNLLIPKFFGGHSREVYTGDKYSQIKGREVPGYWGHMPFTSTTDYLGVITVFFAAIAVAFRWRERWVATLTLLIIFSFFLAFGRHLPFLYDLFFNYFPFFNKFRIPIMALVLVLFSCAVLAGFGLDYLATLTKEKLSDRKILQKFLIVTGIFVLIGLVPFIFKGLFSFTRPQEVNQYQPQVLSILQGVRYEFMKADALRMLILVLGVFLAIFAYLKGLFNRGIFLGLILIILMIDLVSINMRYMRVLVPKTNLERYFAEAPTDKFLKKDTSVFRVLPLGNMYEDNRWSYRHQSIGGYHPAKLRIYQDIRESCMFQGSAAGFGNPAAIPINWNIVNMLNGKYIISPNALQHEKLMQVDSDKRNNITVYENAEALPRAFFVGKVEVIAGRERRLQRLNDPTFNPAERAIVEKDIEGIVEPSQQSVSITRYEPNYIDVQVETDTRALLVLSEIYYPAGWRAFVDGEETEIYKTNHVLRSVVVPPGSHLIEFTFEPRSYTSSTNISLFSIVFVYGILLVAFVMPFIRKKTATTSV